MKKPFLLYLLITGLLISTIAFLLCILHKQTNQIELLELKIETDSIKYNQQISENINAFKFKQIAVNAFPESPIVLVGDSVHAQVNISAFDMIINGNHMGIPYLVVGNEIDTVNLKMIRKCDTILQNSWDAKLSLKTGKIGPNTIVGLYCIPDTISNKTLHFPFRLKFNVIDK